MLETKSVMPLKVFPPRAFVTKPPTPLVPIPIACSPPAMLYLLANSDAQVKTFLLFWNGLGSDTRPPKPPPPPPNPNAGCGAPQAKGKAAQKSNCHTGQSR